MKLYRMTTAALLLLAGASAFGVQPESITVVEQGQSAMPADLHEEARAQLALVQAQLDQDITGYTNDQLLNWFSQVDNTLNGFLRSLGRQQWKQGVGIYSEYKNKLRSKFFNAGGKFPRSIKFAPAQVKAPLYPADQK